MISAKSAQTKFKLLKVAKNLLHHAGMVQLKFGTRAIVNCFRRYGLQLIQKKFMLPLIC